MTNNHAPRTKADQDTAMICVLCAGVFHTERDLRNHQQSAHSAVVSNPLHSRGDASESDGQEESA
jgi:hypothetical protein